MASVTSTGGGSHKSKESIDWYAGRAADVGAPTAAFAPPAASLASHPEEDSDEDGVMVTPPQSVTPIPDIQVSEPVGSDGLPEDVDGRNRKELLYCKGDNC